MKTKFILNIFPYFLERFFAEPQQKKNCPADLIQEHEIHEISSKNEAKIY